MPRRSGNHEFNYGLDFLMKSLAGADFPIVTANMATSEGADPTKDTTLLPPYVILDREVTDGAGESHPIRIGLIGFVPPQIMQWDAAPPRRQRHHPGHRGNGRGLSFRRCVRKAPTSSSRCRIPGIGAPEASDMMENASTALGLVDGIDAILTGPFSHLVFPSAHLRRLGRRGCLVPRRSTARPRSWAASGARIWASST